MLPETEFSKKRIMTFLLVSGRYYNLNGKRIVSDQADNYLELMGIKFQFSPGREISEEERVYFARNRQNIEQLKKDLEADVQKSNIFGSLKEALGLERDVEFFLENICATQQEGIVIPGYQNISSGTRRDIELKPFYRDIIGDASAIINGRIYPILFGDPLFGRFNGRGFRIGGSKLTVSQAEKQYQSKLESEVQEIVFDNLSQVRDLNADLVKTKLKNKILSERMSAFMHDDFVEFGDLGFDKRSRKVYWMIRPHYNSNQGRSYGVGESAVALPFRDKTISSGFAFFERSSKDQPFRDTSASCCTGTLSPGGSDIESMMVYLRNYADMVGEQGTYYVAPASSDSGDGY